MDSCSRDCCEIFVASTNAETVVSATVAAVVVAAVILVALTFAVVVVVGFDATGVVVAALVSLSEKGEVQEDAGFEVVADASDCM